MKTLTLTRIGLGSVPVATAATTVAGIGNCCTGQAVNPWLLLASLAAGALLIATGGKKKG